MPIIDTNRSDTQDNTVVSIGEDGSSDLVKIGTKLGGEKSLHVIAEISGVTSVTTSTISRVDVASAARTVSGTSASIDSSGFGCISFLVDVTAFSGTNPTLQISLETSVDGTNWIEYVNTQRIVSTGVLEFQRGAIGSKFYRYVWTITGTTPSFTFSINVNLKDYLPKRSAVLTKYADLDITSVNNVSSIFRASDSSNVSVVTVRIDDGGSSSQFLVQASNDGMDDWAPITGNISQPKASTIVNTFSNQAFRFYRLIVKSTGGTGTKTLDIFWGAN